MTDIDEVYRTYFTDVYRYLVSLCRDPVLAEELTQDAFFRALKAIDGFNGSCSLYSWLCQIAKNCYFTYAKRQKRELPECAPDIDIEKSFLDRDAARSLHRILHALPEPYKEVFTLRTFGELPFSQIGELFGRSESWARVTYHRARLKIREASE